MSNKKDKRSDQQKQLDALKDSLAGKEIVKWEDVKRKEGANSTFDLNFLDQGRNTALIKLEDKKATFSVTEFKEALEKAIQPEQSINHYRELKTLLVEQGELLRNKAGLTDKEIEEYKEKVDDLIVQTNTVRYEDAIERLSDDAGFEELEKLQKEYKRSIETLAIETVVQDKKQLTGAKVDLLAMLRGEDNDE